MPVLNFPTDNFERPRYERNIYRNNPEITFEQANPEMMGAKYGSDLLKNAIENQKQAIAAKYMQPGLEEQLKQLRMNTDILRPQAEYAPQFNQAALAEALLKAPKAQSEIDRMYMATIPLEQAHTRLYGAQADLYPQKTRSDMALNQAHINVLNEQAKYKPWEKQERALELAEAKENMKAYSQEFKGANESAKDAIQMENLINQFNSAYAKISAKGPVLGRTPAVTSEAQMADNAAQNMQQMILKLMKTNKMTNYELQFAGNLKLNRAMQPDAVKDIGDFLKAKSGRLIEEQRFLNSAKKKGIDAEEARMLWNTYDNERPVYDFEKRSINKDNLNTSKDYLNPEKIENNYQYDTSLPQSSRNAIEDQKNINGKQFIKVNGEWYLQ